MNNGQKQLEKIFISFFFLNKSDVSVTEKNAASYVQFGHRKQEFVNFPGLRLKMHQEITTEKGRKLNSCYGYGFHV